MVAEFHRLAPPFQPGPGTFDVYVELRQRLSECVYATAKELGIDPLLFKVWHENKALTKVGSRVPAPAIFEKKEGRHEEDDDQAMFDQMIRLAKPGGESTVITSVRQAMCSILADYNVEIIRVFVLLPPDQIDHRAEIEERFRKAVPAAGLPT